MFQKLLKSVLLLLCCVGTQHLFAQLIPDSTFSQDGYFINSSTTDGESGSRVFELADGSTILGGTKNGKLRVRKYDAVGNAVTSFGTAGEASIASLDANPGYCNMIYDLEVTSDGKIWVLIELAEMNLAQFDSSKAVIVLARFNANGSADNTFNSNGYILSRPNPNYYFHPKSMCINTKNDAYEAFVGSWVYENGHASCPMGFGKWCVSKYNNDGTPDATFYNNVGYMLESASVIKQSSTQSPIAIPYDMKVTSAGNIIVCGSMHNFDQSFFSFSITPSGQWNTSYGNNGRCIHPVTFEVPTNDLTNAQVLKDESCAFYSILRYFGTTDSSVMNVVKNTPNGTVATTFGTAGKLTTTYLSQQYPVLIFKSNGDFLLNYYRPYGANFADQKIEFKFYKANGTQDLTFGIGGICKTQPRNPDTYINRSTVFHGIWNKNETGLYLATNNQIPGTNSGYGIFKYKWPGLTPLNTTLVTENMSVNLYPNPIIGQQQFYVNSDREIQVVSLYDAKGMKIAIQTNFTSNQNATIQPLVTLSTGLYYVLCEGKSSKKMQAVLVK